MKYISLTGLMTRYFFVGSICLLFLFACENSQPKYNVVIVTFDTTRSDHIGAYGKDDAQTITLDALAKDGVVYENALAPIPITLPSHSSIMTGKVPFTHGVRDNGLFKLSNSQNTLAEILKDKGYQTAAAIGSFPLISKFGINQGFDYYNEHITQKYEDVFGDRTIPKDALFFDERKAAQVNDAIMPWIDDHAQSPFFVWFHYFDPHHPHEPPSPYNQSFVHDLYQGEIAYADESLGNVIAQLKQLNVYDNTLIIFTSDHGEGLDEHNESTHSLLIYNSTLHVPLIVKYPNQLYANSRVKQWVGLIDIFPTILSTLNIEVPDDIQGKTLPLENDEKSAHELYSETLSPRFSNGWGEQRGLVKNGYKYIYGPLKELYNLKEDPHEVNNLITENPQLAESMKVDLQDYIDENRNSDQTNSSIDVDSDTLDILRGLGYVQSSSDAVDVFEEKLNDEGDAPQLHAETISTYSTAKQMLFKKKYIQAIRYLDDLIANDGSNLAYIELKIQAELEIGNLQVVESLILNLPKDRFGTITQAKRLEMLAYIKMRGGSIEESKKLYLLSQKYEMSLSGQYQLSNFALAEKNYLQQQTHLKNILTLEPNTITTINDLAISYSQSGDIYDAEKSFILAINKNPFYAKSYYNYGSFLNSLLDYSSAEEQFKLAINSQKDYYIAYYALIEVLIKLNKVPEAEAFLKVFYKNAPNSPYYKKAENLVSSETQEVQQ